jgi:hypothetical protein
MNSFGRLGLATASAWSMHADQTAKGKTTHRKIGMIHLQNLPHLHNDRDAIEFRRRTLACLFVSSLRARRIILEPASLPPVACDLTLRSDRPVRSDHEWTVRLQTNAGGNSTRADSLSPGEETQGAVMNPNEQKPGQQGGQGGQQGGGGQPKPGQQGQEPGQGGQQGGQQKPGQGGQGSQR